MLYRIRKIKNVHQRGREYVNFKSDGRSCRHDVFVGQRTLRDLRQFSTYADDRTDNKIMVPKIHTGRSDSRTQFKLTNVTVRTPSNTGAKPQLLRERPYKQEKKTDGELT